MNQEAPDQKRNRGIYLLPNLLTTAALFAGFYAVVAAMKGFFDVAAFSIFVAMVADNLDGRVARMTNTESDFGAQYDSLSDMLAFGLAPALVVYAWGLMYLGKPGWLAAFIYAAATALRLARFNTQLTVADKRYFTGLPSPAAAGLIVSTVWVAHLYGIDSWLAIGGVAVLTVLAGALMVSNVSYYSFKELDFKGRVPFVAILAAVLVFVVISIDPPLVLFAAFSVYALSGIVMMAYSWWRGWNGRTK